MENNNNLELLNNQKVSFDNLIENIFGEYDVYIPLIQRNYKWEPATASKLATDLYYSFKRNKENQYEEKQYTVGLITIFKNDDSKTMQIIDGQQRAITLYMLLKYLKPKDTFSFKFERDESLDDGEKRSDYLKNIVDCENWRNTYTDTKRFRDNYMSMKDSLDEFCLTAEDKIAFFEYVLNYLKMILHISEIEPFDEFMNLNNNKTRFFICDRIKAQLMLDKSENKEEMLGLFQDLSAKMYNNSIYNIINKNVVENKNPIQSDQRLKYTLYPDENRLKLLFGERYGVDVYDVNSTDGYKYDEELKVLKKYLVFLEVIEKDNNVKNVNIKNGFNSLNTRFFKILKDNPSGETIESCLLNAVLKVNEEEEVVDKNDFIQSQLTPEDTSKFSKKDTEWSYKATDEFDNYFSPIYQNYIKEKYEKGE